MRLVDQHSEGDLDVLSVAGEIDMHFAPGLRALLQAEAKKKCPVLLLDMSGVEFIDSVGIAAILEYLRVASNSGTRFCIGGLSPTLRTIFEVVGLGNVMPIYIDAAKARDAVMTNSLPPVPKRLFAAAA